MSRTLGPVAHQAFVYPDFEATPRALAAHGNPMQVVQEFSDPTSGRTFEIYCEPLGVKNPLLFQLMRADLFDAWFEAMHEIARNWDGSEPIRDALALMGGVVAKSAGIGAKGVALLGPWLSRHSATEQWNRSSFNACSELAESTE